MYRWARYAGCSTIGSKIDWTTTCGVATDLQSRILRRGGARLRFSNSPYSVSSGTFVKNGAGREAGGTGRFVTRASPAALAGAPAGGHRPRGLAPLRRVAGQACLEDREGPPPLRLH